MAEDRLVAIEGGLSEEEALLRDASSGDDAAVRRLYRAHVDRVHRCVARILGPHDPDVDDVVQQVFLAALDGRFDGRSKLSTWMVGIATRRALDASRARARRHRWSKVTEWVGLGRPAEAPNARHDALSQAEAALATLTPEQRTVFVLHQVEGYTFKEISEMTSTGISTLHARLKAARRRLDELLEELRDEADPEEATDERA
ncbi:MAG: RNA polymerase sigma factor [Sandaracinaceae bacterium]|nr:MAG: RNA polymerase sigma factor [Sandaracinaceae bacterium]